MKRLTKFIAAFLVATMCLSQVQMAYVFADDVESPVIEETVEESVSEPDEAAETVEESEPEQVAEPEIELQEPDEATDSVLELVGAEAPEPLDSEGAARTDEKRIQGTFNTEKTTVTTTSNSDGSVVGNMTAIISGISNPENAELAAKIITDGMPSLEQYSSVYYTDEYYIDAEKYNNNIPGYDSQHCWAATASNILWTSGYAQEAINPQTGTFFKSEDEVLHYFTSNFTDLPGVPDGAVNWFLYGEEAYEYTGEAGVAQLKYPGTNSGGLLKNLSFTPRRGLIRQSVESINVVEQLDNYGVGAQLREILADGSVNMKGAHWLTIVGAVIDNLATTVGNKFKALILADSDNTPVNGDMSVSDAEKFQAKTNAENRYTLYKVTLKQFGEGDYRWVLDGYSRYGAVLCYLYSLENNGGKGGPGDCDIADPEDTIKEQFNQMGIEVEVEKVENAAENVVAAVPNKTEAMEAIAKVFDVLTKEQLETKEVIKNLKDTLLANNMVVYAPNSNAVSVDNKEIYTAYVASPVTFLAGIEANGYVLGLNEYNLVELGNGMYKIEFSNEFLKKLPKGKNIIKLKIDGIELPVEIVINII
ncbi:MAG: hypothetical protein Q4D29_06125 [Lachnospiraceae bacterium]|nr:hypothetical protein [Lachnospiraceae bacterium]